MVFVAKEQNKMANREKYPDVVENKLCVNQRIARFGPAGQIIYRKAT